MNTPNNQLDEIVKKIEVGAFVAMAKSREDGSPKHHEEMRAEAKQAINEYVLGIIGGDVQKTKEVEGSPVAMYYVNKRLKEQRQRLGEHHV